MEYRILGPLDVIDEARTVVLPRGRARALLAILVLRAGEVVSTDQLVDELWGESPPPTVAAALHNLVSALRKRLEPTRATGSAPKVLETCPPGYVLTIDGGQVDANRFRRLVEEAANAPAPDRAAQLRSALALWRGRALADFTYQPFAQAPITELEELRLTAIEQRVEADLALGRNAELVAELEGLCAEHPLREGLRGQLMMALYRCGRQADALKVYGDARRVLVEELGVEPGPELRSLERAVLRQDPSLDLPPLPASSQRTPGRPEVVATVAGGPWLPAGRKLVTVVFVGLALASAGGGDDPEAAQTRSVVTRMRRCRTPAKRAVDPPASSRR
ncbi:MAG: AfsR/SARP family transcriptional regulator [Actinomycetota bacterium]|nr:AfsR/SARP family transcriptional regulator [Actinomycetota bacterium]